MTAKIETVIGYEKDNGITQRRSDGTYNIPQSEWWPPKAEEIEPFAPRDHWTGEIYGSIAGDFLQRKPFQINFYPQTINQRLTEMERKIDEILEKVSIIRKVVL